MLIKKLKQLLTTKKADTLTILLNADATRQPQSTRHIQAHQTINAADIIRNSKMQDAQDYRQVAKAIYLHVSAAHADKCDIVVTGSILIDILVAHVRNICTLHKQTVLLNCRHAHGTR